MKLTPLCLLPMHVKADYISCGISQAVSEQQSLGFKLIALKTQFTNWAALVSNTVLFNNFSDILFSQKCGHCEL